MPNEGVKYRIRGLNIFYHWSFSQTHYNQFGRWDISNILLYLVFGCLSSYGDHYILYGALPHVVYQVILSEIPIGSI